MRACTATALSTPLLLLAAALAVASSASASSPELRLLEWLRAQRGAVVADLTVGKTCPTCPRGLLAGRAFEQNETVLQVPLSAALVLSPGEHKASAAEQARALLIRRHTEPEWNATWHPYLATLPAPGEDGVLTPYQMSLQEAAQLQHGDLQALAMFMRQQAEETYRGRHADPAEPPLDSLVPGVSLADFLHLAGVIECRYFGALAGRPSAPYLLPGIELLNHADEAPSVPPQQAATLAREVVDGTMRTYAARALRRGEELTINYKRGVTHRPDMTQIIYGFVVPRERPLLAGVDLPSYSFNAIWAKTPLDDSAYNDPAARATPAELDRLRRILTGLPTTEAEDQALLESAGAGWRERSILLFRIMRKRALRQTIERIQAALQQQQQEGQGSGTAPVVAGGASTQAPPSQRVRPQQRAAAAEAGADAAGSGRDEL